MKLAACLTGAFAACAMLLPGAAAAAPQMATHTVTTTDHGRVTSTTTTRHGNAWHGRTRWKTQCTTSWRHGRKYRTCRKVRVRW